MNRSIPADGDPKDFQPKPGKSLVQASAALSMAKTIKGIKTRKVALLVADGFDEGELAQVKKALLDQGAQAKIIAPHLGTLKGAKGTEIPVDFSLLTAASVLFDALYIPGGTGNPVVLNNEPEAIEFIRDAFKHCKTLGGNAVNAPLLRLADPGLEKLIGSDAKALAKVFNKNGVVLAPSNLAQDLIREFIGAMDEGRHWIREADKPL